MPPFMTIVGAHLVRVEKIIEDHQPSRGHPVKHVKDGMARDVCSFITGLNPIPMQVIGLVRGNPFLRTYKLHPRRPLGIDFFLQNNGLCKIDSRDG